MIANSENFQRQQQEQATLTKFTETTRIVEEIIRNLDDQSLYQIFSQCESDFQKTYDLIFNESYRVLFGRRGTVQEAHLGYMDKLAANTEETLRIESLNYFLVSCYPDFDINWHHVEWSNFAQQYRRLAVVAPRDHGKSMAAGTLIRMADGTLKNVEDVKAGDYVMGINSIPRKVLSSHSGEDEMFHIHQKRAMSYTCNSRHELHYIHEGQKFNKEVVEVLKRGKWYQKRMFGYRQGFDLPVRKYLIEPYYLGIWLGDGCASVTSVSSVDPQIHHYVKEYANKLGMRYSSNGWNENYKCPDNHNIVAKNKGVKNKLKLFLQKYEVLNNKHIPEVYLLGSKQQRLELLAGLIDTDGNLHDGCYYVGFVSERLTRDVKKLCDTLGFRCSVYQRKMKINSKVYGDNYDYKSWECCITGDIHEVPVKLPRKKKEENKQKDRKNFQNSKITVEPAGWGKYYGFSIEGEDKLFLLEDGTVCHNSYFWSNVYPTWRMYRYKAKNAFITNPRPDIYLAEFGAIITNEASLGEELLEIMKNSIEANPILRERLYPAKVGSGPSTNWAMRKIKARNGARLITKSYGTKFRGRHPGYIICDDFMDDSSLYSKEQREKFVNYFQSVLMNAVLKEGHVINVGTPFHENDLFGVLKKRKGWRVFVYPAITPEGEVLWPKRYSIQDLMDKRDENGSIAFSREQLCKPIVSDASIFPFQLVSKAFKGMENYRLVHNRESFPIKFNQVITAGDFAMSANIGADYTVFMTFGIDADDNRWLIHFWRARGKSFQEQMLQLRRINAEFRPDCIMLESNQFQQIFVQEADRQNLPVIGHNTNTNKYDMKDGVPGLAMTFERGKFRFPRGDEFSRDATDLVASELGSIAFTDKGLQGVGEHDDTAMCLWIADCAVRYISTGFRFSA